MRYFEHELYWQEIKGIIAAKNAIENLSNKTIVITGARGLIGSTLVDTIMYANEENNLDCHVYAIGRNKKANVERFAKYIDSPLFDFVQADINTDKLDIAGNIDYFVHAASNTHPVYYAQKPIETILTNTIGTINTLNFAVEHSCKRYVFLSSVEVYGENNSDKQTFAESDFGYIDCNTLRAGYPESKRVGEALCQAYAKEKRLDFVTARIARCYGVGLLAEDSKALSQFLRKAANDENIVLKSEGTQYYSYVYVADVADALLFLLTKGKRGNAYNVTGKDSDIKLKDLAKKIADEVGKKVVFDLSEQTEREGYSKATVAVLDGGKLDELGWTAKYSIDEGIGRTLTVMKRCR